LYILLLLTPTILTELVFLSIYLRLYNSLREPAKLPVIQLSYLSFNCSIVIVLTDQRVMSIQNICHL